MFFCIKLVYMQVILANMIIEEGQEFTCEMVLVNFNGEKQVGYILAF